MKVLVGVVLAGAVAVALVLLGFAGPVFAELGAVVALLG